MALDGITLHEGYNNFGTFEIDITSVEIDSAVDGEIRKVAIPPVPENLLFKFIFDPSGGPVPQDYTVKLDLPPLDDATAISSELIARGGQKDFSFTLSNSPVKAGSLIITDGLETFTDNGDGTLRGSEGGSGAINYTTGAGSVTFFTPPVFGDNIIANYKKHISISGEDLGASSTATTYNLTLVHGDVVPTSFTLTIGTVTLTDNGSGGLTGTGGSGTINYATGAITINLTTVPSGHFMASYTYWGAATPETVGMGALTTSFNFSLVHHPIIKGTLTATDGTENFTDNSDGTLTGSLGGSGTINYDTGIGTLSFTSAPAWGVEITTGYSTGNVMLETNTDSQGFVEITAPVYPVVTVKSTGDTFIDFDVVGTLDDRQDELYLMLDGGGTGPIYTLITDMFVKSGYLQVFDGDTTYYKLYPNIAIGTGITAVKINGKGDVFGYNNSTHQWTYIDTLTFHSIQHPEFFDVVSDGFYSPNTSTGTDTSGHLGTTSTEFEGFKGVVNNPEPYYISVGISVFEPGAAIPVKMQDFAYLMPGDMNYHIVEVTADPYVAPDQTPTLNDIESITGVSFSTAFRTFLSSKGINTIDSARRAGPITYINGYPTTLSPDEVALLQSHVDLYSINQDATQNQILVAAGYGDLFKIANTARNAFLDDVVGTGMPLFRAAQIQEVTTQNVSLIGNLLSGVLTDLRLGTPAIPAVTGSNFVSIALSPVVSSCGCNECQSGLSPFAYLMDLLKYGSAHIKHTVTTTYDPSVPNLSSFVSITSDQFLQPFGSYKVDCKTLHTEYCRVRLVTEVLEKWVTIRTPFILPTPLQNLTAERKQFLLLVYKTILLQAGTSIDELRNVVTTTPQSKKIEAAQKLSSRLGIPLYMPSSPTTLTADRMWLTFNGGVTPPQDLTAANLEEIFGFRDTTRNVLTDTPLSLIEQWHASYLRDLWNSEDYPLSSYTREGVIPATDATFKTNWKPIIDPDIMGWGDFTYLKETSFPISNYTKDLWVNRKEDIDSFLSYCISDTSNISRTSADFDKRILKVLDRNLVNHVIELNQIQIQDSVMPFPWTTFEIVNRKLIETDTNILLSTTVGGSFVNMVEPYGASPTMRYNRVINVVTPMSTATTTYTFTWSGDPVIVDKIVGGYAKLISSGEPSTVFQTSDSSIVSISTSSNSVTLTLSTTPSSNFRTLGTRQFIYEAEVPLYSTEAVDPSKLCYELINTNQNYSLLSPAPGGLTNPFPYAVWGPITWAGITGANDYIKLKNLKQLIDAGQATTAQLDIIATDLHMTRDSFNRMMKLFVSCEMYLNSMYTFDRPTSQDLYELASIIRTCGNYSLRDIWVKEEIKHVIAGNPAKLMLSGEYFWKSLLEPAVGTWDPSLQTLPDAPIIDPELISYTDIVTNPEAKPYRDLYVSRQTTLDNQFTSSYLPQVIPYTQTGFEQILNHINTGSYGSAYNILPYTSLQDLLNDLNSFDAFKQKSASSVLWSSFSISGEDFNEIAGVKGNYESNDPNLIPSEAQIKKVVKLLVSGYKRQRLYPGGSGWLYEETSGTYTSPSLPVFYYNVLNMRLPIGRGDQNARIEWQKTLQNWNRLPFVHPDIVPPENIINFVPSNWIYTKWNSRNSDLITANTTLTSYINSGVGNTGILFTNFKDQIDLAVSRGDTYTPYGTNDYLNYFTEIKDREENGEDIRPILNQLGIMTIEYRYLAKIYDLLENTPGGTNPPPLIDSEYQDIIDILIAIHTRNLTFTEVQEEFTQGVLLDQDYFQIYKPQPDNFPVTDLPVFNQWRSPLSIRKRWTDTLQMRIDREKAVTDKWADVLMQADDKNMPLMRDALIRALTGACEDWRDVAERLAKMFFIETKDNCCVKHTRISFAIETIQGFYYSLQTGVYADFVTYYKLLAPNFVKEWEWLGTFNSWRSAMFVYYYPENILYPTLKRLQSPAFADLSYQIQNSGSLNPLDACDAGKKFEEYLNDVNYLGLICTACCRGAISIKPADECCSGDRIEMPFFTFFFAQAKSGKPYWSYKLTEDDSDSSHGFWEELPIKRTDITLIGCAPFGERGGPNWGPTSLSLFLYYTYKSPEGKLILAYIKKDLYVPDSEWSDEIVTAALPAYDTTSILPYKVTAIQQRFDWDVPTFILSYNLGTQSHHVFYWYLWRTNVWDNFLSFNQRPNYVLNEDPVMGIRIGIDSGMQNVSGTLDCVVIVFRTQIVYSAIFPNGTFGIVSWAGLDSVQGVFESITSNQTIIAAYTVAGQQLYMKIEPRWFTYQTNNGVGYYLEIAGGTTVLSNITVPPMLSRILPMWSEKDAPRQFAINAEYAGLPYATNISHTNTDFTITGLYALVPEGNFSSSISIESADCIQDMDTRSWIIKKLLEWNLNLPLSNYNPNIQRSLAVKELLYEAYYFVPVLLALELQKRGQYDAALAWYRSVYDYTNPLQDKRKIFYGLKLEENIANVYSQSQDWLLDPLNPHLIAQTRTNAYTRFTLMNLIQCLYSYADREYTIDTIETVPIARRFYTTALDLLKVKELTQQTNLCLTKASNCLNSSIYVGDPYWSGAFRQLQGNVAQLGDPALIESVVDGIVDIYEAEYPDLPSFFSQAFDYVEGSMPPDPTPQTISDSLSGYSGRINDAGRYLFALNEPAQFNEAVEGMFRSFVAGISGVGVSEVDSTGSVGRISWLSDPVPDNQTDYQFQFANTSGQQLMSGDRVYNPTNPLPVPFVANLVYSNAVAVGGQQWLPTYIPLIDFVFCTPDNPVYNMLGLKGNVELYKIHNCRNIAGMIRELDPLSSVSNNTVPIIGSNGNLTLPGANNYLPSQYRFKALIARAKDVTSLAQQIEALFLSALEKKDAENYAQLQARQDIETARANVKLQDLRINEALDEKDLANIQLNKATFSQTYYEDLIAQGLTNYEQQSLNYISEVLRYLNEAADKYAYAAKKQDSGTTLEANYMAAEFNTRANIDSTSSSYQAQLASFERRSQEWEFQSELAKFDVSAANQQVKISDDNVRIVTQEKEIAQLGVDHAQDTYEFLKNKFTNAALYDWMSNVLEGCYNYLLNLATGVAKTAESQLYFERQQQAGPFIQNDYWQAPINQSNSGSSTISQDRKGLTGSARLAVDITRLEQYALDTAKRKLQVTKIIPVGRYFPVEFQTFKETGVLTFELTNKLFDYDFPGHYLRLINSVKVSVVGLIPVFDGIKATLSADTISYTVVNGVNFQRIPLRRTEVESVALSSANNASGLFEMFPIQDDMLAPFEGMGIESKWEFKMPKFTNHFDYDNIADVLVTVEYTAFDSSEYRTQVLQDLDNTISFNRAFSLKNNFPDQWFELGSAQAGPLTFEVTVQLKQEYFPTGIENLRLNGSDIVLYFERQDGFTDEIKNIDFNLAGVTLTPDKETTDGKFDTSNGLMNNLNPNGSPVMNLTLSFANNITNRELFTKNNVKDILLLVGCKADLIQYPL